MNILHIFSYLETNYHIKSALSDITCDDGDIGELDIYDQDVLHSNTICLSYVLH